MPIHDWTRVRANRFHHFHQSWTTAICNALNAGELPPGYFAMIEQKAGRPEADVITLDLNPPAGSAPPGGLAVAEAPPKTRSLVPKLCLGTPSAKLCFAPLSGDGPCETELREDCSQTELGNQRKERQSPCELSP